MILQKRLRIFAGPNGSGKSTIVNIVKEQAVDFGVYVNADDIKTELVNSGFVDFDLFGISISEIDFKTGLINSAFYDVETREKAVVSVSIELNKLRCSDENNYDFISTFTAEFTRNKLLDKGVKFTFETVMSHASKLDFIKKASECGYKTYMYFVSLEDPELNKERVKARVKLNGHDVPEDKIVTRYYRTMDLLYEAIRLVDKAYFFDNSGRKSVFFAKYANSEIIFEDVENVPRWFYTYVLDKIK